MPKNLVFDTKTKSLAWPEQKLEIPSSKWFWTSYISFLTFRLIWGLWKWFQMIPHAQKPGVCHQNHVSSLSRTKVTDLGVLRGMIFPKYFLTPPKNHEICKKSKNGVHFILSVFKVVRVKVLSFLLVSAYFILFWGGQNVLIFFSESFFKTRQKSHENGQKWQK